MFYFSKGNELYVDYKFLQANLFLFMVVVTNEVPPTCNRKYLPKHLKRATSVLAKSARDHLTFY